MKSYYVTSTLKRNDMFWQDAQQAAMAINNKLGANGRTTDPRDSEAEIERLDAKHLALVVESIEVQE